LVSAWIPPLPVEYADDGVAPMAWWAPGGVDEQGGVGVLVGELLAHPLHLHPVGEVGGDPGGRAVLGQGLERLVHLVLAIADDDGAAARGHDVGGCLPAHPAAAADDHQFLTGEDGHGHRLDAQAASLLLVQRPASPRRPRRTSSDRLSVPVSRPGRCRVRSCR
jgi:hypothetical protein